MKTITKAVFALILSSFALLAPTSVHATCAPGFLIVTDVYQVTSANGGPYAFIYARSEHTWATSNTIYYYFTRDPAAIATAVTVHSTGQTSAISGDAFCTGTGYQYGGNIMSLDTY